MQPTASFDWDESKDIGNQDKHGVSFSEAQHAFSDPRRVILRDILHSADEDRLVCVGRVGRGTLTVRFTYRDGIIRIHGAGYWRKGKRLYEEKYSLHE